MVSTNTPRDTPRRHPGSGYHARYGRNFPPDTPRRLLRSTAAQDDQIDHFRKSPRRTAPVDRHITT